jgi:predicted  nucleic acid-binding Zn-ribbon protein
MAKKMTKSSTPAKSSKKPVKVMAKKAVKEAKKSAPVKKKKEEKAKPVSKNKATVAKSSTKPAAKNLKAPDKKIVKKAMPEKKVSKAPAAKKPIVAPKKAAKSVTKPTAPAKKAAAPVAKPIAKKSETKKVVAPKSVPAKPAAKAQAKPAAKAAVKTAVAKKDVKVEPVAKKTETPKAKEVEVKAAVAKPAVVAAEAPKKKEAKVAKPEPKAVVDEAPSDRPKPRIIEFKRDNKPTANPVFVNNPEGMAAVKFAPVARIEKNEKKESTEDMKSSNRFAFVEGDNKTTGVTIENKLRALFDVQLIDSRIDKIHATRGELPLEVEDLENEVAGLTTRVGKVQEEVDSTLEDIDAKKQGIKDAEAQIKKYKEQLEKVKNNREYEALNKEIEFQDLEIQLLKKKIREGESLHELKLANLETSQQKLEARSNDLEFKKKQLSEIIAETEREEDILKAKSAEAKKLIDQRLLDAYERIRKGATNGLAVVPIDREASAGSFIHIPPQKQMDVAARKKVIIDEHSGRILVDSILAMEQSEKINAMLEKELKK